jgi:hypothetical protein
MSFPTGDSDKSLFIIRQGQHVEVITNEYHRTRAFLRSKLEHPTNLWSGGEDSGISQMMSFS